MVSLWVIVSGCLWLVLVSGLSVIISWIAHLLLTKVWKVRVGFFQVLPAVALAFFTVMMIHAIESFQDPVSVDEEDGFRFFVEPKFWIAVMIAAGGVSMIANINPLKTGLSIAAGLFTLIVLAYIVDSSLYLGAAGPLLILYGAPLGFAGYHIVKGGRLKQKRTVSNEEQCP